MAAGTERAGKGGGAGVTPTAIFDGTEWREVRKVTHILSFSQFGELLDIDPKKIAAVTLDYSTRSILVEESDMAQTSGTIPALTKGKGGKKGKRGG